MSDVKLSRAERAWDRLFAGSQVDLALELCISRVALWKLRTLQHEKEPLSLIYLMAPVLRRRGHRAITVEVIREMWRKAKEASNG